MLRWSFLKRMAAGSSQGVKSSLSPLEAFTQLQLGIIPPLSVQRSFLLEHCEQQLEKRGITEAKLFALDGKLCTQLLKQLVFERYLSVPFRVYSFDMEFTAPPAFTQEGPTEDITELGLYSPSREETFSCLVQPACGRKQGPGVAELTHITDEMLAKDGLPFVQAWQRFMDFVNTPEPNELPGAERRVLLLSHGGKLADVSLIKWTLERFNLELPPSIIFGDTIHLIRDAHRRRPVTVDKHPPSWKLLDLVQWLAIPPTLPAHRAGNDAKMTWDALHHTLLRYGDDELTPREQLVFRFFDEEAKHRMKTTFRRHQQDVDILAIDSDLDTVSYSPSVSSSLSSPSARGESASELLELDFDDIFKDTTQQRGAGGGSEVIPESADDRGDGEESVDDGADHSIRTPSRSPELLAPAKVSSAKSQRTRGHKASAPATKSPAKRRGPTPLC